MLDNTLLELREELNRLIENKADFEEIQKISRKLDECLLNYYNEKMKNGL